MRIFFPSANCPTKSKAQPHVGCLPNGYLREATKILPDCQSERGVALILVLFVVALCSVLVTQMTYTSTIDTSLHLMSQRSLQAEYLGKSAVNVARALLKIDATAYDHLNYTQDISEFWSYFYEGQVVDKALLGIRDPAVQVYLEIRAEDSKFPIHALKDGIATNTFQKNWRDAFVELFRSRGGFDNDKLPDGTGFFPGVVFSAEEVVASIIDYQDKDHLSYDDVNFAKGKEASLADEDMKNGEIDDLDELYAIPGFNGDRIQRVANYIASRGSSSTVNINLISQSLLPMVHPDISPAMAEQIVAERSQEAFQSLSDARLQSIFSSVDYDEIRPMFKLGGGVFQVIAKVDYGASTTFVRAYVTKGSVGDLPKISKIEIF